MHEIFVESLAESTIINISVPPHFKCRPVGTKYSEFLKVYGMPPLLLIVPVLHLTKVAR